jgi:hypothetical protein
VNWADVFLGLIALATSLMALIQVGAIVYAGRTAARMEQLVSQIQRDVQPVVQKLTAVAEDAHRVSSIAVTQAERVDKLVADMSVRLDTTLVEIHRAIIGPAREGMALMAGLRAGFESLRELRRRRSSRHEEDDALFIG